MNMRKHLALACMALAFITAGTSMAASISIANFNFEAVPVPDWYWVPDWDEGGASYVEPSNAATYGWSGAGRVLYMDAGGWVSQNLGYNWTAGDVFTLGLKGNQGWRSGGSFKIQLREADGTVLWDSGTIPVTSTVSNFTWTIASSTFTSGTPGSQLNLRIECLANTVYLDDVTLSAVSDTTPPTLASSNIVDDKDGATIATNTLVTYTVTFSEDMDAGTVSASDFGNAGTAAVTIGTVTETTPTSGVFTMPVTPTGTGTLQLKVNAGAGLNDAMGNALATTSAILDDTTITVAITPGNTGYGGTITYTDSNGANPRPTTPYIPGYVVHTFTSSGTLNIPVPASADVLVVAGGGAGGNHAGGGGGAGGLIYYGAEIPSGGHAEGTSYAVTGGSNYTVTVGAGGTISGAAAAIGTSGGDSRFGSLTAFGGGYGGSRDRSGPSTGGSGGGGCGGAGVTGAASSDSSQGYAGGNGSDGGYYPGGGGGGAGGAGAPGNNTASGACAAGGPGLSYSISGTPTPYARGGAGVYDWAPVSPQANAAANNGNGGNGVQYLGTTVGANGGSGIVIVRYPYAGPSGTLISFF